MDIEPYLVSLNKGISRDMNVDLLQDFSRDEISTALFQMGLDKAPGPDGFTAGFFSEKLEDNG